MLLTALTVMAAGCGPSSPSASLTPSACSRCRRALGGGVAIRIPPRV